jgi:hypothetical protein
MKVYVVVMDYDDDGREQLESVFLKRENADAFCDELNEYGAGDLARVMTVNVADADEENAK